MVFRAACQLLAETSKVVRLVAIVKEILTETRANEHSAVCFSTTYECEMQGFAVGFCMINGASRWIVVPHAYLLLQCNGFVKLTL